MEKNSSVAINILAVPQYRIATQSITNARHIIHCNHALRCGKSDRRHCRKAEQPLPPTVFSADLFLDKKATGIFFSHTICCKIHFKDNIIAETTLFLPRCSPTTTSGLYVLLTFITFTFTDNG